MVSQVGLIYREPEAHGGRVRGFLAAPVRGKLLRREHAGDPCTYRARLAPLDGFQLLGSVARDEYGCLVGAVELNSAIDSARKGRVSPRGRAPLRGDAVARSRSVPV